MSHAPQPPTRSIFLSRATHGLSGLHSALRQRDPFLALVSLAALLSEFLPLLLANVPFNLTQTYRTHVICARASLAVLGFMAGTLGLSFVLRWPSMPVDPRTVAGAMFYVSGSRGLLGMMDGVAGMGSKERQKRVAEGGGRYFYGDVGGGRVGVEVDGPGV